MFNVATNSISWGIEGYEVRKTYADPLKEI
jgi:hypothetical protein